MQLVPTAINHAIARRALLTGKSAPTILLATGVAGMVGSTVLACRATLKMDEVVDRTRENLDISRSMRARDELEHQEAVKNHTTPDGAIAYTQGDYAHDVKIIYARAIRDASKLYAPAVVLGVVSIACLTKSNEILTKRNAALTAAYVAVDEAFVQYRKRVVEKYGEEQDREFRYGIHEVDMIDNETGKTYKEKRPDELPSMYARFFDEYSTSWSKEPDYNYVFLSCQQKYANDMLKARGHLFLNEVYDMLGISRTTAGSVVGWVISTGDGDNYVDFGIFKGRGVAHSIEDLDLRDFINGRNGSVLLDFNVDGIIYDKIDHNKESIQWQS